MKIQMVCSCALLLATVATCAAQTDEAPMPLKPVPAAEPIPAPAKSYGAAESIPAPLGTMPPPAAVTGGAGLPVGSGLSHWMTYAQPNCCGPVGGDGPIWTELYARTGFAFVVGGGEISDRLNTGWMIQFGGRSIFFNAPMDRAWTVDLSIANIYNNGEGNQTPLIIQGDPSTVRDMNRTMVNATVGREYWLAGSGDSCDRNWRVGWDAGALYGAGRLGLNGTAIGFRRITTWNWGPIVAVHSDVEWPWGDFAIITGVRLEWHDSYNRRLPVDGTQVTDLNLLFTVGLRY
ncbi:MAG: hypothetical protein JNM56_03550 [Planctomycetia bacterium]|nr:hypothetical protein [Planctomycetia bacterium]